MLTFIINENVSELWGAFYSNTNMHRARAHCFQSHFIRCPMVGCTVNHTENRCELPPKLPTWANGRRDIVTINFRKRESLNI